MITAPSRFGGFLRRREVRSTAHREQHRHRVTEISHIRVRQLLDSASTAARTRFMRSQLEVLSREKDFCALKQTLVAWCECGFSLVTTSQRLAIHRNPVIYRLDKISRLT